jgi:hypothetical protein
MLSTSRFCFFLLLFSFLLNLPIISKDQLVDIDYNIVIAPLKSISSVSDYLSAIKKNKILDLQYVRDFSLLIDLSIEDLLGHQVHGLFNVLFWIFSAFILLLILKELGVTSTAIYITALLFITHPLTSWVLSWPSARKHLLSLFFIALASYYAVLLKKRKVKWQIPILIFYLLSVFSQPISALWVLGFFIYFFEEIKSHRVLFLFYSLITAMILVLVANFFYFSFVYPLATGVPKLSNSSALDLVTSVAAISRSLTQILIPIDFAFDYKKDSFFNMLGLPLYATIFLSFAAKLRKQASFLFLCLIFSPFFIVYYKPTNIFVSDTYLVTSLFFTLLFFAYSLKKYVWGHKSKIFGCILILIFSLKNIREQLYATDAYEYYRQAYEREPTCRNAIPYAEVELYRDREKFIKVASLAIEQQCLFRGEQGTANNLRIYFYLLFYDKSTSLDSKFKSLQSLKVKRADLFLLENLLGKLLTIPNFVKHPGLSNLVSRKDKDLIGKSLLYVCEFHPEQCDEKRLIKLLKDELSF